MDKQYEIMQGLIIYFFEHQLTLKMYHFQTKKYGAHKASDKYLDAFANTFDKFMETAQGIFGRLETNHIAVKFDTVSDITINEHLSKYIKNLKQLDKVFENYSELLNIRDELVANAEQLEYLLTFN